MQQNKIIKLEEKINNLEQKKEELSEESSSEESLPEKSNS